MTDAEHGPQRRVVLLDRFGYGLYRHRNGRRFLPAQDYCVRLVTSVDKLAESTGPELEMVVGVSPYDEVAIIGAARYLHSAGQVCADRFVTLTEMLLVPLAQLRAELDIPGQTVEQALLFRDKVKMKEHLRSHGIAVPDFAAFTLEAASALFKKHASLFVKPRLSGGSFDAFPIRSHADLEKFAASYRAKLDRFEIEEYIDGRQFHIDSIVDSGKVLVALAGENIDSTLAYRTLEPFREVSISDGPMLDALLKFNQRVISCYPDYTGVIHHEVFLRQDGEPVFCEITSRAGGGGIAAGFESRTGIHLYEAVLHSQATGRVPALPTSVADHRTGFAVIYGGGGTLTRPMTPPDEPWIIDAEIHSEVGDEVEPPRHWGEMLAVVTVRGDTDAEVLAHVDEVIDRMRPCIS